MVSGVTGRIPQGSDCVRPADAGNPTQLSCWTWQVEDHTGKTTEKKEVCADYRSYESQPWTEMKMSMALLRSAYSYMQALMSLRKILKTIYSFWDR